MVHSRKPSLIWAALLGALMALAVTASAQVTDEFHRTVPLSANGRVSLSNINGNVTITGWERNEVQIDAVKKARDQQKLDEARIEVDASSDSVRIRTRYPEGHNNNNPATVTYTLHVPRAAHLDSIELVNGSLDVSQVSGDIKAELVNGKATVHDLSGRGQDVVGQRSDQRVLQIAPERQRDSPEVGQWFDQPRIASVAQRRRQRLDGERRHKHRLSLAGPG